MPIHAERWPRAEDRLLLPEGPYSYCIVFAAAAVAIGIIVIVCVVVVVGELIPRPEPHGGVAGGRGYACCELGGDSRSVS